jgi:integrase/recombinase XerD
MNEQNTFRSAIATDALRYVTLKQSLGRQFEHATTVLLKLDAFLLEVGGPTVDLTVETFNKWSHTLESLSPNTRLDRMQVVKNFCIYRRRTAPDCFLPDRSQFPKARPRVTPHIFSEAEMARLLGHCEAQPEDSVRSPLRWSSIRLAIMLLYATGLRRGELFRLTPKDYDHGDRTLLIRASKFHKSRLLPLPNDLAQQVDQYLHARRKAYVVALETEPLLWSPHRRNHAYTGTWLGENLQILFDRSAIKKADGNRPRVHDFRHACAVNVLIRWYRAGLDVQAKLPLLATWLGHVSIFSTYYYLHFVEDLRSLANSRFTKLYGGLISSCETRGENR